MTEPRDAGDRRALLQRAYAAIDAQQARIRELEARLAREPIAIVGLSCRFPGAPDPEAYWDLLRSGTDAIGEVPADRWNVGEFYDADPDAPGRMYTRHGGFLGDVAGFDAAFFGISPREAAAMDPQQRLLLETTWDALDRAGQPRDRLAGSSTGVFIGITANEYAQLPQTPDGLSGIDAYHITGNTLNAAAGRIAYTLGFRGPAVAVDTACSSSLVAVHLACAAIWQGDCDQAIAGGVHLILSPAGHVALSKARVLSPGGRCRTFDESADGMARGEGCGVVVLRKLSDAVRDGDPIVAVIRGSAVNQDGPSSGLTVPNGPAQEDVIRRALANAGVEPQQVDYVEAHGTATPLGDPIEIKAIGAALCQGRVATTPLLVGSVKTNLGHMEAAAGIAGLIKVALALQNGEIPPHLHFTTPSPRIPWAELPIAVVTRRHPWAAGARPRLAGVSAFGFSGTNAHVVLAEPPAPSVERAAHDERASEDERKGNAVYALRVAARSEAAFAVLAERYARHVESHPEQRLADICATANNGRGDGVERGVVIARSRAELVAGLDRLARGDRAPGVARGRAPERPRIGFVYAAHAVHPGFARDLYEGEPIFRDAIDRCASAAVPVLGGDLRDALYGAAGARLREPAYARLADFAIATGLTAVWRAWGIAPWGVAGIDAGEYAAAVAAGVLDVERVARLVVEPGMSLDAAIAADGRQPQVHFERRPGQQRDDASARLRAQGCDVLVDIGLRGDIGARAELLEHAAALYVAGARLDWAAIDHRFNPRRVVLPAYPWQRQRFWIDRPVPAGGLHTREELARGARSDFADPSTTPAPPSLTQEHAEGTAPAGAGDDPCTGWSYEIAWQMSEASSTGSAARLPSGPALERRVEAHLADVRAAAATKEYADALDALEQRALRLAAQALVRLGLDPRRQSPASTAVLTSQLGVAAAREPLFARILGMLEEVGAAARDGERWRCVPARWPAAPVDTLETLVARHPSAEAEFRILERCGGSLPDVLRGAVDPLTLLFPSNGAFTAAHLYGESPAARTMNGIVQQVVRAMVSAIGDSEHGAPVSTGSGRTASDRDAAPLRLLEVGAGTGGTTASILPLLNALPRTPEYTFTDVSPAFLAPAPARFPQAPFLRTARLDIETPPAGQGFIAGAHDVVVAANVLHATADLGRSLDHVAQLLAPGGLLVLQEWTGSMRAIDLIFGLTDGWWRFADRDVRADHPLLSTERWRALLEKHGFEEVALLGSAPGDRGALEKQAVIVARRKPASGRWLVVGSETRFAEPVRAALAAKGHDAVSVGAGELTTSLGGQVSRSGLGEALAGIVDLRALDAVSNHDNLSGEDVQRAADDASGDLLRLVQALARGVSSDCRLLVVTRDAVATTGERPDGLTQSPLWGIGKVVALEHPNLRTTLIDVDEATDVATAIAEAIERDVSETQQAFRQQRRFVPRLRPYQPVHPRSPMRFDAAGAYIVTGGFGGLGVRLAEWLVAKGAGLVVLIGRRPPSNEAAQAIRAIESRGARILARQADVAAADQIEAVLDEVRRTRFRIAGIFHAAGVLDDGILLQVDEARLSQAMLPKVQGAWNLHVATRADRLDAFVLFSAATSMFGSAGQASHAAANAFLDTFATYRRASGRPALSVNWGAWEEIGAAAGEDVARRVRMKGLRGIEPARGLAILERLMQGHTSQVGVFGVDWDAIPAAMKALPFLADCLTSRPIAAVAPAASFATELAAAPAHRRRTLLAEHVRAEIRRVLALDVGAPIDMKQGLFDLGVDSLTSMELRNRLQSTCNCTLPSTLVFDYPTPDAIVARIMALIAVDEARPAVDADDTTRAGSAQQSRQRGADSTSSADSDDVAGQLGRKLAELRASLGS